MIGGASPEELKERFILLSQPLLPLSAGVEPQLRAIDGIRFVMFDFYGTLFISGVGEIGIDENPNQREQFQLAMAACGLPAGPRAATEGLAIFNRTVEAHRQRLIREGIDHPEPTIEQVWLEVFEELSGSGLFEEGAGLPLARRFAVEFEARINPVWPMPGLDRMLLELKQTGRTAGIISNSQFYTPLALEALTRSTLEQMGFHPGLLHWSFREQVKKPSLRFYQGFLEKLTTLYPDAGASEVLYIGNDMLKDVWPASQLGMRTALFAGDSRSLRRREEDERCRSLQPDLVLTELTQVIDCIE